MKRKISISRKFFLNSLVILSLILFYLIHLFFKESSVRNNQIISDLSIELSFAEKSFDDSTKYISLILGEIAVEINKNPESKKHIADVLRHYRILHENKIKSILSISVFSWVDAQNKLVVSSEVGIIDNAIDLSFRDYLQMTKKDPNKLYFGSPVTGAVSSQGIIPAGIGIFSKSGKYEGSIIMGFNLDGIYQKFLQNRSVKESNLQILYNDEIHLIKALPNIDKKYLAKINKNSFDIQLLKQPVIFSPNPILLYKKIIDTPYGLLLNFNNLDQSNIIKNTFLVEFASTALGFILLVALLRKNFINPISQLSKKAELIAAGNKNIEIPESNIIEINQLYQAIISIKKFIQSERELKGQLYVMNSKLQSLSGAFGHEMRNFLGVIRFAQNQIKELATKETEIDKNQLVELTSQISNAVISADNTINIILGDLREKPIDPDDFSYLEASKIISEIMEKFSYNSEAEKFKVTLNVTSENNFIFKAIEDRFILVIQNLLKNALYYLKDYPTSVVTIGAEVGNGINNADNSIDFSKYNVIYVHDTGPGIPSKIIPKLFDDFFTVGKKDGTGLGLSFCKSNMQIFDGNIIVKSELGQNGKNGWTKFSLLFPKLSNEEIDKWIIEEKKRKILIIDDGKGEMADMKSKLENSLKNVSCDVAKNGFEAIKMSGENKYHLILTDVQMPEINGAETAKEIRRWDKNIPIIAYSSLDKKSFLKEVNNSLLKSDFSYYLNKSEVNNILLRQIFKWLVDVEDDFSYLGEKDEYIKVLKNKKVLIADDQQTIRLMVKRMLEAYGMQVSEVSDGRKLLEIYQNNLDENGRSNFDIIITDINMPPYNGDEAAKDIREIEASNHVTHQIPIIALSGNREMKDVHYFFECQITDYFVKGSNPELLTKMIANYLIKKSPEPLNIKDKSSLQNHLKTTPLQIINEYNLNRFNQKDKDEILKLFLQDSPDIMDKIIESAKKNDAKKVLSHLHTLRGNAASVGAERLFNYIVEIESKLLNIILSDLPADWLEKLEIIYDEAEKEVKNLVSTNL